MASRGNTFIVGNVAREITKNVLKNYGGIWSNNMTYGISNNKVSRIYQNNNVYIFGNIGDGQIANNTNSRGTILNNVTLSSSGIQGNDIVGNIAGNITSSISSNGSTVDLICGNFVSGSISNNSCLGEISSNYAKEIVNNI